MHRHLRKGAIGLLMIAGILSFNVAHAASIGDRVSQLERANAAQGQLLTSLQQQVNDAQRDIDDLRGQIQTSQYQLNQLMERQRTLSQQMEALANTQATAPKTTAAKPQASVRSTKEADKVAGSGNEEKDYQAAIGYVMKQKDYDKGLDAFTAFVNDYPNSKHAANANYWLGQLLFIKNQKDEATRYFAIVVRDYPTSAKASDALLKIGIVMQDKKQNDSAQKIYRQVIKQYPNTESAKQAQQRLDSIQ